MPDDKHARVAREVIELTFVPNDLATLDKIDAVLRREYANVRVEVLREAAKAICLWCDGHPVWQKDLPTHATRSASGSWWHNESPDGAFAGCLAGPIHELIEAAQTKLVRKEK